VFLSRSRERKGPPRSGGKVRVFFLPPSSFLPPSFFLPSSSVSAHALKKKEDPHPTLSRSRERATFNRQVDIPHEPTI
jgi:hypothetical protein